MVINQMKPILCDNIMDTSLDVLRMSLFSILEPNSKLTYFDNAEYVRLLGEYAGLYQYASELYVHLIAQVRKFAEEKCPHMKIEAMDKRDMVEQFLKAVKMNYDALSRKITVFHTEENNE